MGQRLVDYLIQCAVDPGERSRFDANPERAMEAAGLLPEERAALRSGDSQRVDLLEQDGPAAIAGFPEPPPLESPRLTRRYAQPDLPELARPGTLVVIGTGIRLLEQLTPEAREHLVGADRAFFAGGAPHLAALRRLNPRLESLDEEYREDRRRLDTYAAMVNRILAPVRAGQRVCAAFYGHPGVFVHASHMAILQARREGHIAWMQPGISAEDCLFADLGFDPGRTGCQSFEATDFLLYRRRFDVHCALVIWQIGAVGQTGYRRSESYERAGLELLVETLERDYGPDHPVVIYEASEYATCEPRLERQPLRAVRVARVGARSTLYVPPRGDAPPDPEVARRLGLPVTGD
jgi:hypothetical protein